MQKKASAGLLFRDFEGMQLGALYDGIGSQALFVRLRVGPEVHGLIAELHADHEEPRREDQAELLVWQARSECASCYGSQHASGKEFQQKRCIKVLTEE